LIFPAPKFIAVFLSEIKKPTHKFHGEGIGGQLPEIDNEKENAGAGSKDIDRAFMKGPRSWSSRSIT
jgi:hypothetical protein